MRHTGRAVVFDCVEDMTERIDLPDLDVHADDILVLRNAGPKGAPGMPEAGYLPIPMKLARQGVKDMVRISDARMSGTAFGTIVLHIHAGVGGWRPARYRPDGRPDSARRRSPPHRTADRRLRTTTSRLAPGSNHHRIAKLPTARLRKAV